MSSLLQHLFDWVALHPIWAGFLVFIISLAESLAVVGLFIPGFIVMTFIGSLVSAGVLKIGATLTFAILGAVVGDSLSFSIGIKCRDNVNNKFSKFFEKYIKYIEKCKLFFEKHGSLSVVIGRFVGPVRPFIPVVAGIMNMCPRKFLIANILSAIAWAPISMLPGLGVYEGFKFFS